MRPTTPPPSNVFEITDASADLNTDYLLGPGNSFFGSLDSGDTDWIAIRLNVGAIYNFQGIGTGVNALSDLDTHLSLYTYNGTKVVTDDALGDDGDALHSEIWFRAEYTGLYFLEIDSSNTGDYEIVTDVASALPPFFVTADEIAGQLTQGYWAQTGDGARRFDVSAGETLAVSITGLTAAGQTLATKALAAWTSVTGINFNFVAVPEGAQIVFDDEADGAFSTSELTPAPDLEKPVYITKSDVNVSANWLDTYGTGVDTYSFQTYIHEIGHALGLGHAGNYNGAATYTVNNKFTNDSWQATVMSYFDQDENPAIDGDFAVSQTPMLADILAIQSLYDTATDLRTGDTVYGVNSTAGAYLDDVLSLRNPVSFTILDHGGRDTINMVRLQADQHIDLRSEAVSSTNGLTGNLVIARGTVIENATGGAGNDTLQGNFVGNVLKGNNGNDALYGAKGRDILRGGNGNDSLNGNQGRDVLDGGKGNDILNGGLHGDYFVFKTNYGHDTITDFQDNKDTIRLDDALWSSAGTLTVQQVIDTYARISNGNVVLDFGPDELTLAGVNNLAVLADDIVII